MSEKTAVVSTPTISASDGGTFKGHTMVEVEGFSAYPVKISAAKAAKIVYAGVSGTLGTIPAFVEEWNKLVGTFGDPQAE